MRLRDLSAVMGLIAATNVGINFDERPRRRRRGRNDAIRNYAAIWIRDHMDFCVCRPDRPRRRGAKRRQAKAARKASNMKGGE